MSAFYHLSLLHTQRLMNIKFMLILNEHEYKKLISHGNFWFYITVHCMHIHTLLKHSQVGEFSLSTTLYF